LSSIWLQARLDTAPQFCGLEIVNAVPYRSAAWHFERAGAHRSASTPPERVTGRLAVRLALQAVARCLSEPVLGISVSLYINPPNAGPGPLGSRITRTSEPNGGNRNGQVPFEQGNRMPRICWQTIFICGNHRGNCKRLKQLELLSRQADIRRVTGASSVNLRSYPPAVAEADLIAPRWRST
jgi:hypothetical protein